MRWRGSSSSRFFRHSFGAAKRGGASERERKTEEPSMASSLSSLRAVNGMGGYAERVRVWRYGVEKAEEMAGRREKGANRGCFEK